LAQGSINQPFIPQMNNKASTMSKKSITKYLSGLFNHELAFLEAVLTFEADGHEGDMCISLREICKIKVHSKSTREAQAMFIEDFIKLYHLGSPGRNLPKRNSHEWEKLMDEIFKNYLPKLQSKNDSDEVEQFALTTKNHKLSAKRYRYGSYQKLTSLASKLAFTFAPLNYWIYDTRLKNAFKLPQNCDYKKLYKVCDDMFEKFSRKHTYKSITKESASEKFKLIINSQNFKRHLENCRRKAALVGIKDNRQFKDFILRRTFDKTMMLEGNFKKEKLFLSKKIIMIAFIV
jgi:hypothetical protein